MSTLLPHTAEHRPYDDVILPPTHGLSGVDSITSIHIEFDALTPQEKEDLVNDRFAISHNPATKQIVFEGDPEELRLLIELGRMIVENTELPHLPISPELQEDPAAELSLQHELKRFVDYAKTKPVQSKFLRDAREQLGPSNADVHQLRVISGIIVAGHQEYQNIYHTLVQLANQDLPYGQYEVALFINLPGGNGERDEELVQSVNLTLDEVERFKQDYPDVNMRYITNTYRGAPRKIGAIRADLAEAVAYDLHQRGRVDDILYVNGDADKESLNTGFLRYMAEKFEQTDADIVTSTLRWQNIPGLASESVANRVLRLQSHLDNLRDRHNPTLMTPDAATGISLATYLAVGGFDKQIALGEMINLTHTIRSYRSGSTETYQPVKTVEVKAERAVLRTKSRRLARAMQLGHSPYNAWDQELITFSADDDLRTAVHDPMAIEATADFMWPAWVEEMLEYYTKPLPAEKRARIQQELRRQLGFTIEE